MFRHRPAGFPLFHVLTLLILISFVPGAGAVELSKRPAVVPETRDGHVAVNIETTSPDAVAALLEQLGGRVDHVFESIDAVARRVTIECDRPLPSHECARPS